MIPTLLEEAEKLPLSERIELVEAIWESIATDAGVDRLPVSEWHREELERRLADLDADPDAGSSWPEVLSAKCDGPGRSLR